MTAVLDPNIVAASDFLRHLGLPENPAREKAFRKGQPTPRIQRSDPVGFLLFRENPNGIHSGTEVDLFVAFVSFCGIRAGQNSTEANEANEDARPRTTDHCPPTNQNEVGRVPLAEPANQNRRWCTPPPSSASGTRPIDP